MRRFTPEQRLKTLFYLFIYLFSKHGFSAANFKSDSHTSANEKICRVWIVSYAEYNMTYNLKKRVL